MENSEEKEEVLIAEMPSEDLVTELCDMAIAIYVYNLVTQNGATPGITQEQLEYLTGSFNGVRHELITRANRGKRKRKVVAS